MGGFEIPNVLLHHLQIHGSGGGGAVVRLSEESFKACRDINPLLLVFAFTFPQEFI